MPDLFKNMSIRKDPKTHSQPKFLVKRRAIKKGLIRVTLGKSGLVFQSGRTYISQDRGPILLDCRSFIHNPTSCAQGSITAAWIQKSDLTSGGQPQ